LKAVVGRMTYLIKRIRMSSIAPLMTKLANLKKLHIAEYDTEPRFVITNQFTARQLSNEAHVLKEIENKGSKLDIAGVTLVIHPNDRTDKIVMEVV
jgi:hypothetical protein